MSGGRPLLIEPINTRDILGFFLSHSHRALEIVEEAFKFYNM